MKLVQTSFPNTLQYHHRYYHDVLNVLSLILTIAFTEKPTKTICSQLVKKLGSLPPFRKAGFKMMSPFSRKRDLSVQKYIVDILLQVL